jgi:hypothetical protein
VALALAGAHEHATGKRVPLPDDIAEQGHVVLPIVDIVQLPVTPGGYRYARLSVMALDQTGTESDHRYVLGNGVLTHNCIDPWLKKSRNCPSCRADFI